MVKTSKVVYRDGDELIYTQQHDDSKPWYRLCKVRHRYQNNALVEFDDGTTAYASLHSLFPLDAMPEVTLWAGALSEFHAASEAARDRIKIASDQIRDFYEVTPKSEATQLRARQLAAKNPYR